MTNEIRIFSADQGKMSVKCYNLGAIIGGQHYQFPIGDPGVRSRTSVKFLTVHDDYVPGFTAKEIIKELFKQNGNFRVAKKRGYVTKGTYTSKWFIEYKPELHDFFVENNIPIPEDTRSFEQKVYDTANSKMIAMGIKQAPGVAAVAAAKQDKELKEVESLKSELAQMKEMLADLTKAKAEPEVKAKPKATAKKAETVKEEEKVTK